MGFLLALHWLQPENTEPSLGTAFSVTVDHGFTLHEAASQRALWCGELATTEPSPETCADTLKTRPAIKSGKDSAALL